MIAEIISWLREQKYGEENILHAAVCCDYAGMVRFEKALRKIIWTSVKDNQPREGQRVLVIQPKTDEPLFATYIDGDFEDPGGTIDGLHLSTLRWSNVTHWMPLPEIIE